MIWDIHTHLTRLLRGKTPAEKAAHLIEVGARHGITRFCCHMGTEWSADPAPEEMQRQNDQILEAAAAHPDQLHGLVYLNPKHTGASLDELKRCVRDGPMIGVKLWISLPCSSPELDPLVELATELQAPVYQHTWLKRAGNLPGESTPADLARLAARHPEARLICGHAGGNWELAIPEIRSFPNIFLELAGFDPTAGATEMAVRELGAERVLYGSDAPGRAFASQLAKIHGAAIPDSQKRLILGENFRRLTAPLFAAKGLTS